MSTIEWKRRVDGPRMAHVMIDGVPACPFAPDNLEPEEQPAPGRQPFGKVCTICLKRASLAERKP